jgi:hypothetical protein
MAALTRFPAKACPTHLDSGVDPGSPAKKKSQSLRSDSNGTEALGDAAEMLRNLADRSSRAALCLTKERVPGGGGAHCRLN